MVSGFDRDRRVDRDGQEAEHLPPAGPGPVHLPAPRDRRPRTTLDRPLPTRPVGETTRGLPSRATPAAPEARRPGPAARLSGRPRRPPDRVKAPATGRHVVRGQRLAPSTVAQPPPTGAGTPWVAARPVTCPDRSRAPRAGARRPDGAERTVETDGLQPEVSRGWGLGRSPPAAFVRHRPHRCRDRRGVEATRRRGDRPLEPHPGQHPDALVGEHFREERRGLGRVERREAGRRARTTVTAPRSGRTPARVRTRSGRR